MSKKKNKYKEYDNMSMDDVIASYVASKRPARSLKEISTPNMDSIKEESIGNIVGNILKNRAEVTRNDGTTIDVTTMYPKDLDADIITPTITPDEAEAIETPVIENTNNINKSFEDLVEPLKITYDERCIKISDGFRDINIDLPSSSTKVQVSMEDEFSTFTDMIVGTLFCVVSESAPDAIYYIDEFVNKFKKVTSYNTDNFLFVLEEELDVVLCYYISNETYNNFMNVYRKFNGEHLAYLSAQTAIISSKKENSFVETLYSNPSAIDEYMDKMSTISEKFYEFFIDDDKTDISNTTGQNLDVCSILTTKRVDLRTLLAEIINSVLPVDESEGVSNDNEPFHDESISDDIREEYEEIKKEAKEEKEEEVKTEEVQEDETSVDEVEDGHITFDDVVESNYDLDNMVIPVIKG